MTYSEIQRIYKERNNKSISSCSIAYAKRKLGLNVRVAYNRIDINKIQKKTSPFDVREVEVILNAYKVSI